MSYTHILPDLLKEIQISVGRMPGGANPPPPERPGTPGSEVPLDIDGTFVLWSGSGWWDAWGGTFHPCVVLGAWKIESARGMPEGGSGQQAVADRKGSSSVGYLVESWAPLVYGGVQDVFGRRLWSRIPTTSRPPPRDKGVGASGLGC